MTKKVFDGDFKSLRVTGPTVLTGGVTAYQGVPGGTTSGTIYYVDSNNGSSTGNGETWETAINTIAGGVALTTSGANDVIYVAPGDYEISAAIAITQNDLTIIGPNRSASDYKALIYSHAAMNLMTINANNVSIIGLGFAAAGGAGHGIKMAGTKAAYKCYVSRCRFDGWGNAGYGIRQDATYDSPDMTVENCLFRNWATGAIYHYGTRNVIRNNLIWVNAASIGINLTASGTNRGDTMVIDNYIIGSNSTDTGIQISATEPTDGTLLVANNVVTNCSTNITQDKSDAGVVNNGTYGDGTAPFQVDPNA